MIKKHFYQKFDNSVPKELETAYNRPVRKQEYSYEKDALSRAYFFGNESELYKHSVVVYQPEQAASDEKKVLYNALNMLKEEYPLEYEVVIEFYFTDKKITMTEIAKRKGKSKQSISKLLKRAYKHLKVYMQSC